MFLAPRGGAFPRNLAMGNCIRAFMDVFRKARGRIYYFAMVCAVWRAFRETFLKVRRLQCHPVTLEGCLLALSTREGVRVLAMSRGRLPVRYSVFSNIGDVPDSIYVWSTVNLGWAEVSTSFAHTRGYSAP